MTTTCPYCSVEIEITPETNPALQGQTHVNRPSLFTPTHQSNTHIKRIEGCPPLLYEFNASGHIVYIGPIQSAATMNVPTEIAAVPVRDLAGTDTNALAVTDKGDRFVWGSNAGGLTSLPDELSKQISKGNTVTVVTISGGCGMAIVKSGNTFFWGTEKQWFGAGVADVNNALNLTLLVEGYS